MSRNKNVCLTVLGDLGRSPRMCYHAASFLRHGYTVHFVGYHHSALPGSLENKLTLENKLSVHGLSEPPTLLQSLPSTLGLGLKFLWQFLTLFWTLFFSVDAKTDLYAIQNPPGVPGLTVVWLVARLRGATFAIDWHNYTDSILALKRNEQSLIVRLAGAFENFFGRRSNINLCVSKAMRRDMEFKRNIEPVATVFYDRPTVALQRAARTNLTDRHELLLKLGADYPEFIRDCSKNETIMSRETADGIELREDRPAILVSSTSWTPDEDFGILLDALIAYNIIAIKNRGTKFARPRLLAVITGKGPDKAYYTERIRTLGLEFVTVVTPWLEPADYPNFLALADLGVCLHTSSSGLDLPMKVVDMLGVGVPVLAKRYRTIDELIIDGENGLLFDTCDELASSLVRLLTDFPKCTHDDNLLLAQLKQFKRLPSWNETWDDVVLPLL